MFEDNFDTHEAFEYWKDNNRSTFGITRTRDETKESGVSRPLPVIGNRFTGADKKECKADQVNDLNLLASSRKEEKRVKGSQESPEIYESCSKTRSSFINLSGYQKIGNPRRNQLYEIGVHKGKHSPYNIEEKVLNTDENPISDDINANGRFVDNFKWLSTDRESYESVNCDNLLPGATGVTINTPLIQELEKQGKIINSRETAQEKTRRRISSEKKYLKENTHAYPDKETEELLDTAIQDYFSEENDKIYLSYGKRKAKQGEEMNKPIYDAEFKNRSFRCFQSNREMYKNPDIKTLGDSLTYFGLFIQLQLLETSLEDLRRNKKTKEDHEECFKHVDKEIQKLSFKYHPDKVKNRGGTEKDIESAQKQQTALNATRTALKLLNSAFMEDIGTDHKFGFYINLNIESLCNEDEMRYRVYEVIFKIGMISRIKQQNIISEIRKCLIESKRCVDSYLNNKINFEKHRDLALFHLKCCVKGFKKLRTELEEVKEQCKLEKNSGNMLSLIQKMAKENERDLNLLRSLKKAANAAVRGMYQFFNPVEVMDPYFVLPLVSYINVVLMCNAMVRKASMFDILNNFTSHLRYSDDLGYLHHAYYLASYCSGNRCLESVVLKIMDKEKLTHQGLKVQVSKEEIELVFHNCIETIKEYMEYKFKVEDYNEAMPVNLLVLDLKKCMTLMSEFEEKEQEVSKGIQEVQKKTQEMDEKFDKMMKATEEMTQKFKERLELNKKFCERVSNSFSDQNYKE